MASPTAGMTRVIPRPLDKCLPLIRRTLQRSGFSIVQECQMSMVQDPLAAPPDTCIVLLVDTTVLLFEAMALDRSAGVFLPLHVVVTGNRESSTVHWVNPIAESGLRPPAPAKAALNNLFKRLIGALSALPQDRREHVTVPE